MKKLFYMVLAALCISGTQANAQNTDGRRIKHANPVIAEQINPTTVWFIHTWNYEYAGDKKPDNFRNYSTNEDSLVKIVPKEAGISLATAQEAYLSGPQKYDYNSYALTLAGKFGLQGTIARKYTMASYDERTGITSLLMTEQFPTTCYSVGWFGFFLMLSMVFAQFKLKHAWTTRQDEWHIAALAIAIVGPVLIVVANSFLTSTDDGLPGLERPLYLYTGFGGAIGWPILFMALCLLIEFFVFELSHDHPGINKFKSDTENTRWMIVGLIFNVIVFHSFTHSFAIVGMWLLAGFGVRAVIYGILAIPKNFSDSHPPQIA